MSDRVIVLSERPATAKSIYNIDFEMENRTPLNCRENPKFSPIFQFNVERTWRKKHIKVEKTDKNLKQIIIYIEILSIL